ncbi:hypothetical protein PCK1_000814 [Pneumocystis canis]|nr:hypothetical protein PCK1_000814 [Pneumocystis canis]
MKLSPNVDCSPVGCVLLLLQTLLPSSFIVTYDKSNTQKSPCVKDAVASVLSQASDVVSDLLECTGIHHLHESNNKHAETRDENGGEQTDGDSSQNNQENPEQSANKQSTRKQLQDCIIM